MTGTEPSTWLAELTDEELYDLTCNAYESSVRRLGAQRELDRRAGPSDLDLLSAALDEIYRLRRAFAYESRVIEAHLDFKTFPKSRRKIAEEQVARMRQAVTNSRVAYAGTSSQSLRRELLNVAGRETLTVASWRDEVTR